MTWVRLDDQFPDHPKALACSAEALWLHISGLCWCARHLTDGHIPKNAVARLAVVKNPPARAAELVDAGIWIDEGSHFVIHDYLDFQPSKETVMSQRDAARDRQRKSRERRGVSAATPTRPDPTRDVTSPPDDDNPLSETGSSSGDLHQPVWLAYAELVADAQAEPPQKRAAFLTKVAKTAARERRSRLVEYLRVDPTASPEMYARWLYDDIDPIHLEQPDLDDDFTPADQLRVVS